MDTPAPVDLADVWRLRRLAWELFYLGLGPMPPRLPGIDYETDSVITRPATAAVPDIYPSSTFGAACRKADAEHARKYGRPAEPADIPLVAELGVPSAATLQREYEHAAARRQHGRLAASTKMAIDFLLKQNDAEVRLRKFLQGRPPVEAKLILQYMKGRADGQNNKCHD